MILVYPHLLLDGNSIITIEIWKDNSPSNIFPKKMTLMFGSLNNSIPRMSILLIIWTEVICLGPWLIKFNRIFPRHLLLSFSKTMEVVEQLLLEVLKRFLPKLYLPWTYPMDLKMELK